MGLRLADNFEIKHDEANNRTILENIQSGEQFILNGDGTTENIGPSDSDIVNAVDGSSLSALDITNQLTDPSGRTHQSEMAQTSDIPSGTTSTTPSDGRESGFFAPSVSWSRQNDAAYSGGIPLFIRASEIQLQGTFANVDYEINYTDGTSITGTLSDSGDAGAIWVSTDPSKTISVVAAESAYLSVVGINRAGVAHSHSI